MASMRHLRGVFQRALEVNLPAVGQQRPAPPMNSRRTKHHHGTGAGPLR